MFSRMRRGACKPFQMPEICVETFASEKPPVWLTLTRSGVCRSIRVVFVERLIFLWGA